MKHERRTKVIVIITLLVAVLGLSVGLSAYSKVLNIQNVQATVQGNESNFDVHFCGGGSGSDTCTSTGQVHGLASGSAYNGATAGTATISGTTISDLTASFTGAAYVTYTFYVYNAGKIPAYLTGITFDNKTCTGVSGTNSELVSAACDDITVKVSVGGKEYSSTNTNIKDSTVLTVGGNDTVSVTIENSSAHAVDGDFTAKIPTITLTYKSQKPTA